MKLGRFVSWGVFGILMVIMIVLGQVFVDKYKTVPNNQYQIYLYPNEYIIKNGDSIVSKVPFGKDHYLDSIFFKDNP